MCVLVVLYFMGRNPAGSLEFFFTTLRSAKGMLAALALADYNVLDEWRKKMGGTVKSTVDPMTGHVSSLHRASSGTGWGGYEDGWDEELEARAAERALYQFMSFRSVCQSMASTLFWSVTIR